jgi:hypothetical protein
MTVMDSTRLGTHLSVVRGGRVGTKHTIADRKAHPAAGQCAVQDDS